MGDIQNLYSFTTILNNTQQKQKASFSNWTKDNLQANSFVCNVKNSSFEFQEVNFAEVKERISNKNLLYKFDVKYNRYNRQENQNLAVNNKVTYTNQKKKALVDSQIIQQQENATPDEIEEDLKEQRAFEFSEQFQEQSLTQNFQLLPKFSQKFAYEYNSRINIVKRFLRAALTLHGEIQFGKSPPKTRLKSVKVKEKKKIKNSSGQSRDITNYKHKHIKIPLRDLIQDYPIRLQFIQKPFQYEYCVGKRPHEFNHRFMLLNQLQLGLAYFKVALQQGQKGQKLLMKFYKRGVTTSNMSLSSNKTEWQIKQSLDFSKVHLLENFNITNKLVQQYKDPQNYSHKWSIKIALPKWSPVYSTIKLNYSKNNVGRTGIQLKDGFSLGDMLPKGWSFALTERASGAELEFTGRRFLQKVSLKKILPYRAGGLGFYLSIDKTQGYILELKQVPDQFRMRSSLQYSLNLQKRFDKNIPQFMLVVKT